MIHPAALPALPGLLPLGGALPALPTEGLEMADFGALLAIESEIQALPVLAAKLSVPTVPVRPATLPAAAALPDDGKTLPVALPAADKEDSPALVTAGIRLPVAEQAAATPSTQAPAESAQPAAAAPVARIAPARPARIERGAPAAASASDASATPALLVGMPPAETPAEPLELPVSAPESQVSPIPQVAGEPSVPAQPQPAMAAVSAPRRQPAVPLIRTGTPAAPQPAPQPLASTTPPAPGAIALPVISVPAVAATPHPPVTQARLRLTLSAARTSALLAGAAASAGDAQLPLAAPAPVPNQTLPAIVSIAPTLEAPVQAAPITAPPVLAQPAFTPADPALRPHDFTQLVDRLVAARELASPQAFQVAVQHGEFGPVQLRFQREGEGLSVTLASADPDFARIAAAAPAPVLPALPGETSGQPGQRFDSPAQNASGNGSPAQHRGGASPERRDEARGPADNPAPPRQGERSGTRRSGIFA